MPGDFFYLARWYASKGHSLYDCLRLALWCLTPETEMENTK